jgi:hypothetical protein
MHKIKANMVVKSRTLKSIKYSVMESHDGYGENENNKFKENFMGLKTITDNQNNN